MKHKLIAIISVLLIMIMLVACGGSSDSYRDTLESGQRKYYNGEKMTQQEYNAVKSFKKWEEKNGEHTYSDWDN